jgi:hypothetical protein
LNGAGEEVRTLDIHLGKVTLYQLSYARNLQMSAVLTGKIIQSRGDNASGFSKNLMYSGFSPWGAVALLCGS